MIITKSKKMRRMKFRLLYFMMFIAVLACEQNTGEMPAPVTTVKEDMEEDGKSEARKKWWEAVHRTDDQTDWRQLRYEYDMLRHKARKESYSFNDLRGAKEVFANGQLTGEWNERGSVNQAGSVIASEYHQEEDRIYLISAGGSLFSGSLDGLDWKVVNDDLRFSGSLLKFMEHQGEERLVAIIDRIPHFSIDKGVSWMPSSGIQIGDRWGNCYSPVVYQGDIFVLSKPDYWSRLKVYRSTDGGSTYSEISELSSHDPAFYSLYQAHFDDALRMVEKDGPTAIKLYTYNESTNTFKIDFRNTAQGFGEARANMAGVVRDDQLELFYYNEENRVMKSTDGGMTWTGLGVIPARPWSVGIFISPSDPDIMLAGAVECHRSTNGGQLWQTINTWGEYYGDVVNKLHADMMYFNEFEDKDGEPFLLISNHGGLSISRDGGIRNLNIGLYGLNVSQYYSVRTDPLDSDIIYAGSQDQGFQRGKDDNAEDLDFDQIISGDYGHIVFTQDGGNMWTVYPGGWVTYYNEPHVQRYPALSYTIDSENESVWMPPLAPHPDPSRDAVYVAGGSLDGGPGSYLIQLEVKDGQMTTSQIDFDFYAASNESVIGAISFSPLNSDRMFVATSNGNIFRSTDGGETFDRGVVKIPGSHYLYGTSIWPSRFDENVVYAGGSGYSNPPVVVSTDGGRIFRDMSDGLPPTLVFQLVANEDESILFAATEAGPFAYIVDEGQWYDISGEYAPAQTYWSVEYLPEQNIARFGTYGRGIWDFEIEKISTSTASPLAENVRIYPNPAREVIFVEDFSADNFQIMGMNGQMVKEGKLSGDRGISIQELHSGTYILRCGQHSKRFIKI